MNQTRSHSISKKLLSLILAMIMVLSLMPMTVLAQEGDAEPTGTVDTYATTENALKNRIVHLDCGRRYFSVDYIKGIIDTMAANGFNQLELAFGNGGLRFVLDDMDIKNDSSTLHNSEEVKAAILEGNKNFYNDPNGNALTETEMKQIIAHANEKGIEIVPLLNMPGHMDGLLSSSLFSQYKLSGSEGSLDLNNSYAVDFGKALLKLYVDWFRTNSASTMHFNFGADEYGQGIRNPYIESSVAKVTYNQLINYMNDCAVVIEGQGLTARCFNDFVCYNNRTDCNLYKTVQVCYWSNQWSGSEYNTPDAIKNAGYTMINTNQKWYFVPSKANEYGKNVVLSNFQTFDVTKYQNIKSGDNSTSTTYTQIPVGTTNVGAMFCVWCDTPSVDVSLTDVQELIAAMADANPSYFTKETEPEKPVIKMGNDTVGSEGITLTVGGSTTLSLSGDATAKWESSDEEILKLQAVSATRAAVTGANAVEVIPVAAGTATITATLDEDGTKLTVQATVQEPGTVPITVTVNGTYDVVVKGKDLRGNTYAPEDADVAKVDNIGYEKVEGSDTFEAANDVSDGSSYVIQVPEGTYLGGSGKTTTNITDAAQWKFVSRGNDSYRLQNEDNEYLQYNNGLTTTTRSNQATTFYFNNGTLYRTRSWRNNNYTYSNPLGIPGTVTTTNPVDQSTVTIKGLKVGTTTITIDGVKYIITVVNEILDGKYIYINYFITNHRVSGSDSKQSIKLDASVAYGQDGVLLKALTAPTGTYYDADNKVTQNVEYYKSEYQAGANIQTYKGWTNKIGTGVSAERVRYFEGSWAVFDGTNWVTINETTTTDPETYAGEDAVAPDGIAAITAYYLQVTDVTQEVTTLVTDWGVEIGSEFNRYSFLDFAVKYESGGARTPSKFANGKTLVYNNSADNDYVWDGSSSSYGRYIHDIYAQNNSQYEVYMITVTESAALTASNSSSITASSTITYTTTDDDETTNDEQVVWVLSQEDLENSSFDDASKQYQGFTIGGEPIVRNIYAANMHGYLVTYYLRAKLTEDALTVHYIDISTGVEDEFYSYNIAVKSGTQFNDGIALPETTTQYTENGKAVSSLTNGRVENFDGHNQYVSSVLTNLTAIGAKYRYTDYECVEVSYDSTSKPKDVYIYYTFSNQRTYVVDFGLPLQIELTDLNESLKNASITNVEVSGAKYGDAVYSNKVITYTLKRMLSEYERITVTVTGRQTVGNETKTSEVSYQVTIIPASTVYYEDSFVEFHNGESTSGTAVWTTAGTDQSGGVYQALEQLDQHKNVYGYDSAYTTSNTFSMGSAMQVTVDANVTKAPNATFTFKGTGFDLVAVSSNKSGTVFVKVDGTMPDGTTENYQWVVDTYYGYKRAWDGTYIQYNWTKDETGKWHVRKETVSEYPKDAKFGPDAMPEGESDTTYDYNYVWETTTEENTLYQIPVIHRTDLPYGDYTVTITPAYASFFNHTNGDSYDFWVDGIRVYNPMNDYAGYAKDSEGHPNFVELRNELIKADSFGTNGTTPGAVFIDGAGKTTEITDYTNYGPNNEVYLAKDQAIAFQLTGTFDAVQIGAKSPNGGAKMEIKVGSSAVQTETLNTATDLYYTIQNAEAGQTVVITNTGDNLLSLTTLKFTSADASATQALVVSQDVVDEAVTMLETMLYSPAPVDPEPTPDPEPATFEPSRFEASWGRAVRAGQKATLTVKTSEDVESITVNGQTIDTYRTRTERSGWGWWSQKVTYREFTFTVTASTTADYTVVALNGDGVASQPITATLTVRSGWNWGNIFGNWF